jgi:hypothetical protein
MLAFAVGLLVWAMTGGMVALRKGVAVAGAVAVAGVVVMIAAPDAAEPLRDRAENVFQFDSGTGGLRVETAETAMDDLDWANAITGLGANSFGQRHLEPTQPGVPGYLGILPLQILYDAGLIGVALLGFAFAKLKPFERERRGRALGVTAAYLVAASATSPFWFGWTWLVIALAVLTVPGRVGPGPTQPAAA